MSTEERNQFIIDNENLAYKLSWKYYPQLNKFLEFEEVVTICKIGLVKAANTYDAKKGIKFSTYAYKIISNDIFLELRRQKRKKDIKFMSLSTPIADNCQLEDIIGDLTDYELKVIDSDMHKSLSLFIDELPIKMQQVIKLSLKGNTQKEIGTLMGISQAHVSRLYKDSLYILREKFNVRGDDNI